MASAKQLKINGHQIEGVHIYVNSSKDPLSGHDRQALQVKIRADGEVYGYEIRAIVEDISVIEAHIKSSLEAAQNDLLNLEIQEDASRRRLSFYVQKIGVQTYIGWRI